MRKFDLLCCRLQAKVWNQSCFFPAAPGALSHIQIVLCSQGRQDVWTKLHHHHIACRRVCLNFSPQCCHCRTSGHVSGRTEETVTVCCGHAGEQAARYLHRAGATRQEMFSVGSEAGVKTKAVQDGVSTLS